MSRQYKDPILKKLIEILDERGPRELKGRYGYGDPGVIQRSQLARPRCFLSYEQQVLTDSAMGMVETNATVLINVVYDMSRDFGQGENAWSHMSVAELVSGRDESMKLRNDTIIGALRKNEHLALDFGQLYIDLGDGTEVEFGLNNRDKGLVTSEAVVKINVKFEEVRDA